MYIFFIYNSLIDFRNQRAAAGLYLSVMERNLLRLKAATMPKSPKTAAEVELEFQKPNRMDEWGYSQVDCDSLILLDFFFMFVYVFLLYI